MWTNREIRDYYNKNARPDWALTAPPDFQDYGGKVAPRSIDIPLVDIPEQEKEYWCTVRSLGNAHCEVSVCRPPKRSWVRRKPNEYGDVPKRVKREVSDLLSQDSIDLENLVRTARRSSQKVRLLIKAGGIDRLMTLTTREVITDRNRFYSIFEEFTRLVRTKYPNWYSVSVPEYQQRGALHLHLGVKGRQDFKWMIYCWQKALGCEHEALSNWFIMGTSLGIQSVGYVDVRPPSKMWGGDGDKWNVDRLASYMTKYITKDFEMTVKGARRYYASRNIPKPIIVKYWLASIDFYDAVHEALDIAEAQNISGLKIRVDNDKGNIYISASREAPLDNRIVVPSIVDLIPF